VQKSRHGVVGSSLELPRASKANISNLFSSCALAQVQIEGDFLACSFSILEEQPMDMLLGLDMLKRHQVIKSFSSFPLWGWGWMAVITSFLSIMYTKKHDFSNLEMSLIMLSYKR
jgi:hypothetical protein